MVFSSLIFLYLFFPLCMLLYFLPVRTSFSIPWRNGVLIAFSLLFYAWGEPMYVLLMLLTAFIDYILAIQIEKASSAGKKRALMAIAVVFNLGFLAFFKYTGFFAQTVNLIPGVELPVPRIVMPIGISFYTFQILSYIIDVYRGNAKAQRSFPKVLLFLTLFHSLVAGPIVRYDHIAKQLDERETDPRQIWAGIERFAAGLAKKALLANTCGELADVLHGMVKISYVAIGGYAHDSGRSSRVAPKRKVVGELRERCRRPEITRRVSGVQVAPHEAV